MHAGGCRLRRGVPRSRACRVTPSDPPAGRPCIRREPEGSCARGSSAVPVGDKC